jgi:hypothetical protein
MQIKPMARIVDRWTRKASASSQDYREGVEAPRRDWAQAAKAAEPAYEQGVQAAIVRKAFGVGVARAGTQKWQRQAISKGPSRFAEGVSQAAPEYEAGFAPYAQVLTALNLPPRGARGDARNIQRVADVAKALHDAKTRRGGVAGGR